MATNNHYRSDLESLHYLVQSSMIVYPKELVISVLKDFFSQDTFYRYVKDEWGFPKTPDHTGLPLAAGMNDDLTTRLFIGENYRFDIIYYPAIIVKSGGMTSTPLSFNRNQGTIQYKKYLYDDGYGNLSEISRPEFFNTAGAWEGSLSIDIYARSLRAADDLAQLCSMALTEIYFDQLVEAGLLVKPISISGSSAQEDRNDKLFRYTITAPIRYEWLRTIPISTLLEVINFVVEFDDLSQSTASPAYNLTIFTDQILSELF
jgi:hypothetical protein